MFVGVANEVAPLVPRLLFTKRALRETSYGAGLRFCERLNATTMHTRASVTKHEEPG